MPDETVLTPADHEHFLTHGYVIVRNVADPETLAAAAASLEGKPYSGTVGKADYKPVRSDALPKCYGPRFAKALSELYGEPVTHGAGFAGTDMPRPFEPGQRIGPVGSHTDDDYPTLMPAGWTLGAFLFLTPVKPGGGAFIYYPGSYHRVRAAMSCGVHLAKQYAGERSIVGAPYEYLAQPGDALLFHQLCAHSGSPNVADPTTTRHALLSRHHPSRRVVPGDKPFERMSTIEKSNSARFLRERFGAGVVLPEISVDRETNAALADGFAGEGGVRAAAAFHFAGRVWLFYVNTQTPGTVCVASSVNFHAWRAEARIESGLPAVDSISLHQRHGPATLFLGSRQGNTTRVLQSSDLVNWTVIQSLADVTCAAGHYSTDYGSKRARGYVTFAQTGNAVRAGCAPTVAEALAAPRTVPACHAGALGVLRDFTTSPTLGEGEFAMALDIADALGRSVPYVVGDRDSVSFAGAPRPLGFDAATPPRHIRVFLVARSYWLVTFLRATDTGERVFWGAIDWASPRPVLHELRTARGLLDAAYVVGLL